jgi:hypothetical protein
VLGFGGGKWKKEPTTKESMEYLLEDILRNKNADGGNTSFAHAPVDISRLKRGPVLYARSSVSSSQNCAPLLSSSRLKWQTIEL